MPKKLDLRFMERKSYEKGFKVQQSGYEYFVPKVVFFILNFVRNLRGQNRQEHLLTN